MVICIGYNPIAGNLKFFDSNFLTQPNFDVPKLGFREVEKINDFFIAVKSKIVTPIDYFTILLDSTYENEFCKKFIEIGHKYDIQNISIIGTHQALLLKAVHDISSPIELDNVLWVFSLWKNQIYATVWQNSEKIGWKFVENQKDQIGLGKNATIKTLLILKSKLEKRFPPTFIMIYDKNFKTSNSKNKLHFAEQICDSRNDVNIFLPCKHVYFQTERNWCEWALIHARIKCGEEFTKYRHQVIFEKNVEIKIATKIILKVSKWQCLPYRKTSSVETYESDNLMTIFEDDAYMCNIRLKKHATLKIMIDVDLNGIYNISYIYDNEEFDIYTEETKKHDVRDEDIYTLTNQVHPLSLKFQQKSWEYVIPRKRNKYDSSLNALGIDLGTTECCVSVIRRNGPDFIALDPITANRTMPSYVAFDEVNPKCGQIVADRMRNKAEYSAFDSKRIIGKVYERVAIDSLWPFKIVNINDTVFVEINTCNGISLKRPEEISAELLKHIKKESEQYQGKFLTDTVITIPSVFSDEQKQATKKAAEIAGWNNIHFLPEPVAAAFAYFAEMEIPNQSNILICDCGGGTTDICVARLVNEQIEILSVDGDSYLGGRDFDKVLFNHFNAILKHKYGIDVKEGNKKYILSQQCQNVKHRLSTTSEDWLTVDNFICDNTDSIYVKKEEFEELSSSLILRIKNVIFNAISKTNLHSNEINYVFQVGGGCRMPMIKEMLKEIFPNSNHQCSLYPDWVVAHGAALYAYYLKTEKTL